MWDDNFGPHPEYFSSGNSDVPNHIEAARRILKDAQEWEARIATLKSGFGAELDKAGFGAAERKLLLAAIAKAVTANSKILANKAEYDRIIASGNDRSLKKNNPVEWARKEIQAGRSNAEVAADLGVPPEKLRNVLRRKHPGRKI